MRSSLLFCLLVSACTTANTNLMNGEDLAGIGGEIDLSGVTGEDLAGVDLRGSRRDLSGNPGDEDLSVGADTDMGTAASTDMAGVVSPSPTPSPSPSPTPSPVCNAIVQGPLTTFYPPVQSLSASGPLSLTVPSGYRVHGTVAFGSSLPAGSTFLQGLISLVDVVSGREYAASGTFIAPSSFLYEVFVPAGDYHVTAAYVVIIADAVHVGFNTRATLIHSESAPLRVCGDTPQTLTYSGYPTLTPHNAQFTGMNALDPLADGAQLVLETLDGSLTLSKAASTTANSRDTFVVQDMPLPDGVMMLPSLRPFQLEDNAPNAGGYEATLRLPNAVMIAATDPAFAPLALPALTKITGTVTDAQNQLYSAGTADLQLHAVHCPHDEDLRVPETSYGSLFTDALTYKTFVRSGESCRLYARFAVSTPQPAVAPTLARENVLSVLDMPIDPPLASPGPTANFAVLNLGSQINIAVTVKDVSNNNLADHTLTFRSVTLTDGNHAGNQLNASVTSDAVGTANAHILPGTYQITIAK